LTPDTERHRELCAPIESAVSPHPAEAFANSLEPERPVQLGLVSGDFQGQHPVNLFMLPLLERLQPEPFTVTVFPPVLCTMTTRPGPSGCLALDRGRQPRRSGPAAAHPGGADRSAD